MLIAQWLWQSANSTALFKLVCAFSANRSAQPTKKIARKRPQRPRVFPSLRFCSTLVPYSNYILSSYFVQISSLWSFTEVSPLVHFASCTVCWLCSTQEVFEHENRVSFLTNSPFNVVQNLFRDESSHIMACINPEHLICSKQCGCFIIKAVLILYAAVFILNVNLCKTPLFDINVTNQGLFKDCYP